jgi:hypothetical protein
MMEQMKNVRLIAPMSEYSSTTLSLYPVMNQVTAYKINEISEFSRITGYNSDYNVHFVHKQI